MSSDWLTFDCYGTLVDWRSGMLADLRPVAGDRAAELLAEYHRHEPVVQQEQPGATYRDVLAEALRRAAAATGIRLPPDGDQVLGSGLTTWPRFPETDDVLLELARTGFKIGILSNVDRELIEVTIRGFPVPVDLLVTSADVGSYKPAAGHFTTFAQRSDVEPGRWVHVACSWFHDVEPAIRHGAPAVYVEREPEGRDTHSAAAVIEDLTPLPDIARALFTDSPQ
ncbi:HAD family hydrolase [Amycolatopsis jejuensis]|uniref:HAD family hydrolase n=1 Tax=Amycolatopsis jejuensis TaxID=330084 RepID=UPI0005269A63|nr:HAD family hydrolase [Amycolatopsis jejuensis]